MMISYLFVFLTLIIVTIVITRKTTTSVTSWPLDYNGKAVNYDADGGENTYTFQPYPGATSYVAEAYNSDNTALIKKNGGEFVSRLTFGTDENLQVIAEQNEQYVRMTARTPDGDRSIQMAPACFLAGAPILMADGSEKNIEDIIVGDLVRGAFGETNKVLALHRPLLGNSKMSKINDHTSSNHHPHVGIDQTFFVGDIAEVTKNTYNNWHPVITENGVEQMFMHGLKPHRIQKLEVGVILQTSKGPRVVETFEVFEMPPETQLYHLVVDNSHTYIVEGYAVTGWPREDDFDYDNWVKV